MRVCCSSAEGAAELSGLGHRGLGLDRHQDVLLRLLGLAVVLALLGKLGPQAARAAFKRKRWGFANQLPVCTARCRGGLLPAPRLDKLPLLIQLGVPRVWSMSPSSSGPARIMSQ